MASVVSISDATLYELVIAAKDAALDLREVSALARIPATDNPKLVRLIRAISAVEKACGVRAVPAQ